jgi:esterase/lipase
MQRFTNPKNLNTKALYQMPKIKSLYIHGLDSSPLPEKIAIMEQAGLEISALHLNYRENKNVYFELKQLIQEKDIEFIIGSSFGGMLAYWLGEDFGIPVLLFNPAIVYQSVQVNIPKITNLKCPLRMVVIGEKDDVIDPHKNKDFFKQKERKLLKQKVLTCNWLGHSIDLQTFDEMIFWAVKNYGIWKLLQLTK